MAVTDNQLFDVQGYVTKNALPLMIAKFSMTATFDSQYEDWKSVNENGVQTRGRKFSVQAPPRSSAADGLTFDPSTGQYLSEYMTVVADQTAHSRDPISAEQLAIYDPDTFMDVMGESQVNSLVEKIERFNCERAANTGFRFIGSPKVNNGQMLSYQQLTLGLNAFGTFGGSGLLKHVHLPSIHSAVITQSGLQQFVTQRNEKIAVNGEIGQLTGAYNARFYQNDFLPNWTSGTASLQDEIEISAVTDSTATDPLTGETILTSTISLTNLATQGGAQATVVEGDLLDVGAATGLTFLTYNGYTPIAHHAQARVITGGQASGGDLDIVVFPRLTYDGAGTDPSRNLNRAIVTGATGDQVRIVRDHQRGVIFYDKFMKFVAPRLPINGQLPTGTKMDPKTKIALRCYSGVTMGSDVHNFVTDCMWGSNGYAPGVGVVVLPPTTMIME